MIPPQGSGIFEEEGAERLHEPVVVGDFKKAAFSRNNRADAHMNPQRLLQHAQDLHKLLPGKSRERRIHNPAAD